MNILHTMLRVKDIQKSLKFYCNFIGLEIQEIKELDDCKLYFLGNKESGHVQIELTDNFDIPENGYQNGNAFGHIAFGTESMEKTGIKLKEAGYDWLYEPFVLEQVNSKIAFVLDPDGNEIEIIQNRNTLFTN